MIYLNVSFDEKDEVKELGAKFNWQLKKWYCTEENKELFTKWLPDVIPFNPSDEQGHAISEAILGNNILIDACIGSGKTTTIQEICNRIPDKKILYLTFNRLLKEDAKKKIIAPNTTVTNYDGFAYQALRNAGLQTDVQKNIRLFNEYLPSTPNYDILILDEYQDIKEDIATMLLTIKERNPGIQIIAVGDMEQKIYDYTALDIKRFINDFLDDYERLNFTKCFRLNSDHAAHLGNLWEKTIQGENETCETKTFNKIKDIVEFLADKDPKDILVLGSRTGVCSKILNKLEEKYPDKFNKQTVYASIKEKDDEKGIISPNSAIFTTFDSSKGLERKYCVIADWDEEHWESRASKPATNYTILKNLFLVAASRGKNMNIFYENKNKDHHFLSDETISTAFQHEYTHDKPFVVSDMFDFLYAEDIIACMDLIKVKTINQKDKEKIPVKTFDNNIDLSPCIGEYVSASFFKKYDIDETADFLLMRNDTDIITPFIKDGKKIAFYDDKATIEQKILMLTATDTHQDRYAWQVKTPFITDDSKQYIEERLKTVFNGKEDVEIPCQITFRNKFSKFEINGRMDVIKDKTIYELKFTSELKETNYLQLAIYLCANPGYKGILWNVKTNEMVEVSVKDKDLFLQRAVKAISKRNLLNPKNFSITDRSEIDFKKYNNNNHENRSFNEYLLD